MRHLLFSVTGNISQKRVTVKLDQNPKMTLTKPPFGRIIQTSARLQTNGEAAMTEESAPSEGQKMWAAMVDGAFLP